MRLGVKITLVVVAFALLGMAAQPLAVYLKQRFDARHLVYTAPDSSLVRSFESQSQSRSIIELQWQALLPDAERDALSQYQTRSSANTVEDVTSNILRSIQAASDQNYQAAMYSTNTLDTYNGAAVAMAGFIVPISFHEDQSPEIVFIVPYFGACIHFPPPPPNQMVFTKLAPGFTDLELEKAYLVSGLFSQGMFEDPMGTAAYQLDTVSIRPFVGNPDDFRSH